VVAVKKTNGADPFSYIRFFSNTMSDILDTYLVVLLALDEICEGNLQLKEDRMVNELHLAIKLLVERGDIKSIQSCLKQTIRNAIQSFSHTGLSEIKFF
jgi:hypothetical protein